MRKKKFFLSQISIPVPNNFVWFNFIKKKKNIKLQNTHTDMTDSHNDIRMKNDTV